MTASSFRHHPDSNLAITCNSKHTTITELQTPNTLDTYQLVRLCRGVINNIKSRRLVSF